MSCTQIFRSKSYVHIFTYIVTVNSIKHILTFYKDGIYGFLSWQIYNFKVLDLGFSFLVMLVSQVNLVAFFFLSL